MTGAVLLLTEADDLGRALIRQTVQAGLRPGLGYRDDRISATALVAAAARAGQPALAFRVAGEDGATLRRAFALTAANLGPVTGAILDLRSVPADGRLAGQDDETLQGSLARPLHAAALFARQALQDLPLGGAWVIIGPGREHHSASVAACRAGLAGLVGALAVEAAGRGLRINLIDGEGDPADLATTASWLLSPAARGVNGRHLGR